MASAKVVGGAVIAAMLGFFVLAAQPTWAQEKPKRLIVCAEPAGIKGTF
jgi:hypothetical protein